MKTNIYVPPIKIQGKKTKLVPFIINNLPESNNTKWVEPFMGSGVVGFNVKPEIAIFGDSNPHIINFYSAIKSGVINARIVKSFLIEEGRVLSEKGVDHFLMIRERFNTNHNPLDFLFLNRSCFNGLIRFNKKLKFNVPYGHKSERFAQAYITKIVNQVKQIEQYTRIYDWEFLCQDFRKTLLEISENSIVYCDPPYIGRHVDYYDSWDEADEIELEKHLSNSGCNFMVSTWHSNEFRANAYINTVWKNYRIETAEHFYHVGAQEENRNPMVEALIMSYQPAIKEVVLKRQQIQLSIFGM
jgi:DNA adenine methylase